MRWLAFVALIAVVLAPAESLRAAAWVPNLDWMSIFAIGGMVVGFAAARTPLRAFAAHVLSLGIGFELVVLRFAQVVDGRDLESRLASVFSKIYSWTEAALHGGASNDNLMFALTLALLCWSLGYLSVWFLMRQHSGWWAIVPAGTILLLNTSYDTSLLRYFYVYVVATLALLIVVDEWRRRDGYVARRMPHQESFPGARVISGLLIAAPLLVLAWQFPPLGASQQLNETWAGGANPMAPFQTRFERLYSAVQARQGSVRALAFARSMAPRSAFELGSTPLLAVQTNSPQYWRANTLDTYDGQTMTSSEVAESEVGPGPISETMPVYRDRVQLVQTIQVLATQTSAVFAADELQLIDTPAILEYRGTTDDFASMRLASPLRKGDTYVVTSTVSIATADSLRQAANLYPDWMSRYLALPDSLPERVKSEAARVVGDASNPYDKAVQIEAYLREMPYTTTDVPVPPPGRDWVDYMLFDARKGYCDYYASAMVVMLRSQGVPARVAQGFATGEWIPERGLYLVRESQAHSWVEVYFPEYGWIVFEPSASRPVPFRVEHDVTPGGLPPIGLNTNPKDSPDIESLRAMRERDLQVPTGIASYLPAIDWIGVLRVLLLLIAGASGVFLVVAGTAYLAWNHGLRGLLWHERLYAQTVRLSAWCGVGMRSNQTPYEQARALGQQVPAAAPLATTIADAYVAGRFGPGASEELKNASTRAWLALRLLLPRSVVPRRIARVTAGPREAAASVAQFARRLANRLPVNRRRS